MIKRDGVVIMNERSKNVSIAKETLQILKDKKYSYNDCDVDISTDLDSAIKNTKLYTPSAAFSSKNNLLYPTIEVVNETTSQAAYRLINSGLSNIVALNFASGRNVGGGFLGGALAQEEDLCRASGLYACIKSKPIFYNENILCDNALYTDNIIYSPNVPFFRDENYQLLNQPFNLSIITSPAPNVSALKDLDQNVLLNTLNNRVAKIIQIAVENNHENIILGAWGCGAFRNDPAIIANVFANTLTRYPHFKHVCFAVLDNRDNAPVFNEFHNKFIV